MQIPLITFPDSDKMICIFEVQFGENGGAMERLKSRTDQR